MQEAAWCTRQRPDCGVRGLPQGWTGALVLVEMSSETLTMGNTGTKK